MISEEVPRCGKLNQMQSLAVDNPGRDFLRFTSLRRDGDYF